jgi:precorrin-2 dehydrogenase/sirohydrochlorin ferrochelatase
MPNKYYPVYLDLEDRACVVVSGDSEAEGKVKGLLESHARVTVISPEVTPGLEELASQGLITWEARPYQEGDLEGAFLAIAETGDTSIKRHIFQAAAEQKVLLNVMDVTHLCTWIAPAIIRRGEVTVAISTGGASPALARKLRESISEAKVLEWADLAPLLSQARSELKRQRIRVTPDHWQACLTEELLSIYQQGRHEEARERLMTTLVDGQTPAKTERGPR